MRRGSCACATSPRSNGSATALPMRVMHSRRLMTFPYGQGFNFSIAATSVDIEACKRSTNVADGSGMARHEPVTRIEDSAETDGQECANGRRCTVGAPLTKASSICLASKAPSQFRNYEKVF